MNIKKKLCAFSAQQKFIKLQIFLLSYSSAVLVLLLDNQKLKKLKSFKKFNSAFLRNILVFYNLFYHNSLMVSDI